MSFMEELKRRNVFRVGIAYLLGAWLLAQIADLVLDVIGAPDIVLRSLVALLALGFVPAVIFAWAFEMTPEGVKRESEVDRTQSITGQTGRKLNLVTIGMVIAVVGFVIVERYLPQRLPGDLPAPAATSVDPQAADTSTDSVTAPATAVDPVSDHSVAVLPFANRSNQDDDLFFTDGIHDDLLTQLAKIHGLRVISRTSVMEYRDTTKNLRQIGGELQVATILEGGIQKVGDRVRINAQLIEVATDRHLWAETFDRELTTENIFDIQSEIARRIVDAVSITLSPEEEQNLAEKPTENLAAYEAFLRAKDAYNHANYSRAREINALPWLEQAIALDPNYTEAYSLLAVLLGQQYWRGLDTSEDLLTRYREILEKAGQLNPRAPSVLRAMADYHYRVENDYQKSYDLLSEALKQAPGNADAYNELALSLRRLGRWDESIDAFKKAIRLDPANSFYRSLILETLQHMGESQQMIALSPALEDADPENLDIQLFRAMAQFDLSGDLTPIDRALQKMKLDSSSAYTQISARVHWLRRDADAVIVTLNNAIWIEAAKEPLTASLRYWELANAYRLKGENEIADRLFETLVEDKAGALQSSLQTRALGGMYIAAGFARLGRDEEALALINTLVDEVPNEVDATIAGGLLAVKALIVGLAGDEEAAIDLLQQAQSMNHTLTDQIRPNSLRLDPHWDFLRNNPRFVELATPDTVIGVTHD